MRQKEYSGYNSIEKNLADVLEQLSTKRIFLVHGKTSYDTCGARERITETLSRFSVCHFDEFSPNPKNEDIQKGIDLFNRFIPDVIIAVGGGSVIDTAKLIKFFAANKIKPYEWPSIFRTTNNAGSPLIAIPTTSGSGSEATHFAVLYIGKRKYSVADQTILPDVAIIDPELTISQSTYLRASAGLDAFCHAIESLWSIHSNIESKRYAKFALKRILPHLVQSVKNPRPADRLAMIEGANLAGKAINISKTTAAHAISYPITSYFGIDHGQAVAITLPELLEYNAAITENDCLDPRGNSYACETMNEILNTLNVKHHWEARKKIQQLIEDVGLETRLGSLNLGPEDVKLIVINVLHSDRLGNNPRRIDENAIKEIMNRVQ
jgi:alcohol dehydrogenase class IV